MILILTCGFCSILVAQKQDSISFKNGIEKPNILSTHHFGIFSSRINTNFKIASQKNTTITFSSASGNNFHPFVETYLPKDPEVRKEQSKLIWYHRNFYFKDQETTPADYMNIVIDAVIKEFRLGINIPLNKKNELDVTLRSYLITKGTHPFSFFTSDENLEWFHSNVAGGEDPFGRRYYGLNQVNFKYTDRNGNTLELNNNDFFLSGIELNYFYYPTFTKSNSKNIYINFGSHLGINTSKYNHSLDFGLSANAIKKIELKNNYEFNAGVAINVLRKNLINFKDVIDLGNNPYLATIESHLEIAKFTKQKNYNALSVNYQIQSRYNQRKEADYYRLIGKWQEINGGWQHGFSTLYTALSYWTFIYTYGRPNLTLSLYFKEDFRVNNAADFQTGISLKVPVFK
ncbi:hypothetical protein CJ739_2249 [Mariniflexile rhizosphaerae]|uniref:hypothetical protein n=1 Tax=unclassified Mariniflexile TaxID=2643887 RepID=UPI000CA678E4|nr:hypothetical protein [Mariniflexile sp. TRM1-10]AXP81329.1 hypothetical protein CJ739_2249 [Mariniflexile sp. TRM1-10]PLB18005.1 MAG: hypothetical protein TRG1_3142 [Flavobacteriaceae bacterium FS1-H7996/R]